MAADQQGNPISGASATAIELFDSAIHAFNIYTNAFGGSHAQRDVIDWTLLEAATRGGLREVANTILNERLARKPHSLRTRQWIERGAAEEAAQTRTG